MVSPAASVSIEMPSWRKAAIITWVSSLSSAPVSVLVPSASAAQTSARLVMLFEPGGRIVAASGEESGRIVIESVGMNVKVKEQVQVASYRDGVVSRLGHLAIGASYLPVAKSKTPIIAAGDKASSAGVRVAREQLRIDFGFHRSPGESMPSRRAVASKLPVCE